MTSRRGFQTRAVYAAVAPPERPADTTRGVEGLITDVHQALERVV